MLSQDHHLFLVDNKTDIQKGGQTEGKPIGPYGVTTLGD